MERRNSDDPEKRRKQAEEKAQKKKIEAEKKEEEARKKEEEAKKKEEEARKKIEENDRRKSEARLSLRTQPPAKDVPDPPRRNSDASRMKPLPPKPAPPKHPRGPDPEPEMEFLKVRLKSANATANASAPTTPAKPLPAVPKAAKNWGQWRRSQDPERAATPTKDNSSKVEPETTTTTTAAASPSPSSNGKDAPAKPAAQRAFVAKRAESGTLSVKTKKETVRAKPTTGFSRFNNKRAKVIEEIILTEADYVADLELIVEIYLLPLRANKLITEAEHATLFLNIEQLLLLQREFLKSLTKDEGGRQVVKAFLEAADYFKSYGVYCSGANPSRALCDQLKKRAPFQTFLDYCAAQPGVALPFDAYLIKPVQRICKYPLLLRELIRETSDNSLEAKSLAQARDKIEAVVTTVNESTRAKELAAVLVELSNRIRKLPAGFVLLEAQRRLLAEGPVMMGPAEGKLSRLYFFLLTDLLLVVKNKRKAYIYATHFMFTDAYVRTSSEEIGDFLFPLRLTAGEEVFVLGLSSVADRDLLLNTFEKHNPAPSLDQPTPAAAAAPASAFSEDDVWVEYKGICLPLAVVCVICLFVCCLKLVRLGCWRYWWDLVVSGLDLSVCLFVLSVD